MGWQLQFIEEGATTNINANYCINDLLPNWWKIVIVFGKITGWRTDTRNQTNQGLAMFESTFFAFFLKIQKT